MNLFRQIFIFLMVSFSIATLPGQSFAQSKNVVGAVGGSFDVTLSGSSTYSIPIRIAPGSAGTEPKLALVYDSQAAGGSVGAGWSIVGLSAITRGPKTLYFDGEVDGVRLQESDALFLDGQRLVPINVSGTGAARRVEFRKEVDDQSQIVQIGSDFSSSRFLVRTKGGLTIVFNGAGGSRIQLSCGPTLLHAASFIFDTTGNLIEFKYQNDGDGDYDIAEINYTGRGTVDLATGQTAIVHTGFASVKFTYTTATRVLEAFVAGHAIKKKRRLDSIQSVVVKERVSSGAGLETVSTYKLGYENRDATANRFVLTSVTQFGEDGSRLAPTKFNYSTPTFGWEDNKYGLPVGISFAQRRQLAGAYRFTRFAEQPSVIPDLLVAAQVNGQLEAFAYRNLGNGRWDPVDGFKPPFAFTNSDGADLGALLIDVNGDGRTDLIQSNKTKDGTVQSSAFLADKDKWLPADAYRVPFNVSVDGQRVATILTGRLGASRKLDLIYDAEGQLGFLENNSAGWTPRSGAFVPPVPLKHFAKLIDVDCDGTPELVGIDPAAVGGAKWRVFRFSATGWVEETRSQFSPEQLIPASINPRALLEVTLTGQTCASLVASTGEGTGFRAAITASPTGWKPVSGKEPPFDLVSADGKPVPVRVVQINGQDSVISNHAVAIGTAIKFAYTQTPTGWAKDASFDPPVLSTSIAGEFDPNPFVGDIDGDQTSDIVLPAASDVGTGRVYKGSTSGFAEVPDFVPRVAFARADQQDRGIRLLDLNGDGLPDIVYFRQGQSADKDEKGAYINTGSGWLPVAGLVPPKPFAADHITGNPVQFVDVDGDGFIDILYSYERANGTKERGYYRNVPCGPNNSEDQKVCDPNRTWDPRIDRKWVLQEKSPGVPSDLAPPADFPFAKEGVGDLGVQIVDINGDGRADIIVGYLPSKGSTGANEPVENCKTENGQQVCELNRKFFRVAAFLNDGSSWARSQDYDPPLPFVSQEANAGGRTRDLFVQIIDVDGDRLPDIVAAFKHPYDNSKDVFEIWTNTGKGWRRDPSIAFPTFANGSPLHLDEPLRDRRALIQWADVNGDGLADIIFTKRVGGTNESATFLSTGRGFVESPAWKLQTVVIADRDGDPSFRLLDVNGDGLLDVVSSREIAGGQKESGIFVNNGSTWVEADKSLSDKIPAFIDENGVDQGVRLFDVDGNGLLDVLQSFTTGGTIPGSATVLLNTGRRSDVLTSIDNGMGLRTTVCYQTLLEVPFDPDPNSPCDKNNAAPWTSVYSPGALAQYPIISPVPASYVVRRAVVDEGNSRSIAFAYRYGEFRMHGLAMRSLGFRWRESFNEATESRILTRTELLQDVKLRNSPVRETTCWLSDQIQPIRAAGSNTARAFDPSPSNWCPSTLTAELAGVYKLSETETSWQLAEKTVGGQNGLPSRLLRQINIASTSSKTFELDGGIVTSQKDSFVYDAPADLLDRRQNVMETLSLRGDGTSIRTTNEYRQDDSAKWFFGRLTRSVVVKGGDEIKPGDTARYTETRIAEFGYDASTGLLAFERANVQSPDQAVTTTYRRDEFGNVVSSEVSAPRQPARTTRTQYDVLGRFAIAETNALGHAVRKEPKLTTGAPLSVTGPNGLTTSYEYDGFGRLLREVSPTGVSSTSELLLPADLNDADAVQGLNVVYVARARTDNLPPTVRLIDAKGRVLRTIAEGFTADAGAKRPIQRDTEYDLLGRPTKTSLPYERGSTRYWAVVDRYDSLGRALRTVAPNGAVTETAYASRAGGGSTLIITDPLGRKTTTTTNMRRLPLLVKDAMGGTVTYVYDAGDRLLTMVGPTGATTRHTYDGVGQRIETSDPDMGRWRYQYDSFGRLVEQIDAKQQITTIEYDLLGRPVRKSQNDATSWWEYDTAARGIGKIASVRGSDGYREDFFYDEFGRQNRWAAVIGNETFATSTQYDPLGRVARLYYPNGVSVENVYDKKGYLQSVRNAYSGLEYWTAIDVDQFGRSTIDLLGNGLSTTRTFDPQSARPQTIYVGQEKEGTVLDLSMKYDLVGNLSSRTEKTGTRPGQPISEGFTYDALDRLTGMSKPNGSDERYAFDAAGRITFKSGVGDYSYAPPVTIALAGEDPNAKPFHAVLQTKSGSTRDSYGYDLNGNMARGPTGAFEYTSDNKMKLLFADQARWVRFDYAPSGARYRQFARTGIEAVETLYLGSYERVTEYVGPLTDARRGKLTRHRIYLSNGDGVFATIETNGEYSDILSQMTGKRANQSTAKIPRSLIETDKVWYLHKDQLGSVIKITDETGRVAAAFWYDPWGKRTAFVHDPKGARSGQRLDDSWDRGFTGHEHMDEFSLVHMNGRVYSPVTALFTSSDPVDLAIGQTQGLGRYRYAKGNPLKFTDPTGLFDLGGAIVGGVIGLVTGGPAGAAAGFIIGGDDNTRKFVEAHWKEAVIIGATVAVSVLVPGSPILIGALAGATSGGLSVALYGGSFDEVLAAAAKGAVIGAFSAGVADAIGTAGVQYNWSEGGAEKIFAHGLAGGVESQIQGGNFGSGFASAAVAQGFAPKISAIRGFEGARAARIAAAALVGGTTASISGGKFVTGAVTAAFLRSFNDEAPAHQRCRREDGCFYSFDEITYKEPILEYEFDLSVGSSVSDLATMSLSTGKMTYSMSYGVVGASYSDGIWSANFGPSCPYGLCSAGISVPLQSRYAIDVSAQARAGAFSGSVRVHEGSGLYRIGQYIENSVIKWISRGY